MWLIVPPVLLCVLDFGLTLYGQSGDYWSGNYANFNEMSPSFAYYLSVHPLVFAAFGLLWIAIFSAAILLLPELLALTVAVAIMIGHLAGAATWLAYHFHNYQACNALILVTAFVLVFSFKQGQRENGGSALNWQGTGLPGWVRWVLVALLFVPPVWWFLVPH